MGSLVPTSALMMPVGLRSSVVQWKKPDLTSEIKALLINALRILYNFICTVDESRHFVVTSLFYLRP